MEVEMDVRLGSIYGAAIFAGSNLVTYGFSLALLAATRME